MTLVRHGQATAFAEESDRLSELGERQAALLGDYWAARGETFDEVWCGTLVRQRRTAEIVAERMRMGAPLSVNPAWNEYDANGVLHKLGPDLAGRDPEFKKLMENAERARGTSEQNRHFQKMFEVAMSLWVRGELTRPEVEPWESFQARVHGAIRALMARGGSRRVVVFTSGGPIGSAVQFALRAPAESAIEVNWRVRNCSLTELVYTAERISLDSFNGMPHLEDRALWSFR